MGTLLQAVLLPAAGWWLLLQVIGLAALPLAFRLFPRFADRGASLAKPLGILITGTAFWLGATFHLFPAERGAAVLLVIVLALAGLLLLGAGRANGEQSPLAWLREHWQLVAASEAVFAVVFFGWAIVRSYNPEIAGTEKPMELAFLNSVMRSEYFPANDPWLSGYSISYYYFGYVLTGMLAKLGGVSSAVAFNLMLATVMGLAAQGAFGLVASLVAARHGEEPVRLRSLVIPGVLAAGLLVFLGNLVGVLDFLITHGFGSAQFWQAVSIDGLNTPSLTNTWYPTEHWWWWKATRVINTFVNGQGIDYTISEFPIFSFVLGDLHPHVLALPFNLLVLGIAFSAYQSPDPWGFGWLRVNWWKGALVAVIIGSLGFLNSWDLPTYAFIVFAAVALRAYQKAGRIDTFLFRDVGLFVVTVGVASVVIYLPFYLHFSSQASGFRPVITASTQIHHYLLFWGPLVAITGGFLANRLAAGLEPAWRRTMQVGLVIGFAPLVAWLLITVPAAARSSTMPALLDLLPSKLLISVPLALLTAASAVVALSARRRVDAFAGLLMMTAFLLQLGAEHFFILDVFGSRMNTVFKLYYQSWALLAVASAFGLYCLWPRRVASPLKMAWAAVCVVLLAGGAYYAVAATYSKANLFRGEPTLDGLAFARQANPDEAAALDWLEADASGAPVVVEATGGQYSEFARVATRTGLPTILGWAGHERQWRGSDEAYRGREQDIDRIYAGASKDETLNLLHQYNAKYVFVGSLEKQKYGAGITGRLGSFLDVGFQNNSVTIYKVR